VTPSQIVLVETSLDRLDLDALAAAFYERALAADPTLAAMFTTDPAVQRARFAAELSEIVRSIRSLDMFGPAARTLGARHRSYGVRAAHYRLMGGALLSALADASGEDWTPELEEAWTLAYNLIAEMMMTGALEDHRADR
jgi:hemoglobin-like flavoprotein